MRPLIIVNPNSAGGKTRRRFEGVLPSLERILGPVETQWTEHPRHAIDLARSAALSSRKVVVAVGGDGTTSEVVQGIMKAKEQGGTGTRLGIIALGTGGDFRRTLGFGAGIEQYAEAIAGGRTRTIDVGRFSYRTHEGIEAESYFVNILSIGIGGLVDQYVAGASRALGGSFAYSVASLRGLVDCQVADIECRFRSHGVVRTERFQTRNIAICNGRFYGGGMELAPMANPADGKFELVCFTETRKLPFLATSTLVYAGRHIGRPGVFHASCDEVEITLINHEIRAKFPLDVDGEPLGTLPVSVKLIPNALEVFVP